MNSFIRIARSLPIDPLLAELAEAPELWGEITARQDHPASPHRDTEAVFLRWCAALDVASVFNDLHAVDYPALRALRGSLDPLLAEVYGRVGGTELGRVMLVSLKPGGTITPHIDEGAYADHYERFHLSLQSEPGNAFYAGDEGTHMLPGELWWFNHKELHSVVNFSSTPRLHLIADIVAPTYRRERAA